MVDARLTVKTRKPMVWSGVVDHSNDVGDLEAMKDQRLINAEFKYSCPFKSDLHP